MKKLLFVLVMLCLTLNVMAQKYEIYQCLQTGVRYDIGNKFNEWEYIEQEFLLRLCLEENKLEFNNIRKSVFYFNEKLTSETNTDEDGDEYRKIEWSGYDEKGLKCHLISIDWINLPNRNFILSYSDAEIIFQCTIMNK